MIEYLIPAVYVLIGSLMAFYTRREIDRQLVENGLQAGSVFAYSFIVLLWPVVIVGEAHGRLTGKA